MTARRAWIDTSPLEIRGVVELDGEPEHLLIDRVGQVASIALGMRFVGRVISAEPRGAFVDLGEGPQGWISSEARSPTRGALLTLEVAAEARAGKGPRLRVLGEGEGKPRRISEPPSLEARLRQLVGSDVVPIARGREAREAADEAQAAALAVGHDLGGGLSLAVEPTRALVAIDVDLGASASASSRRSANLRAVRAAARLLRLKALGGTIVIDLAGLRPDVGRLRDEARAAFAPDGDAVRLWPGAGPGLLVVSTPHRRRPLHEDLLGVDGAPTARTRAAELLRELERQATADPGARFRIDVPAELGAVMGEAIARLGPRFSLRSALGAAPAKADIVRL